MGEKISDYINNASATPNSQSLLDLSEFNGSTYESVKWQLADFLTWLNNNVSFSEVYTFYNNSGATLEKGTPVKINSLQSGVVAVSDYDILPNNASSQIFVAKEQILNGAQGVFIKAGLIDNIDTSSFTIGQTIYFNYTTGIITGTYATDVIYLGIVITSAVTGSIFVAPEKAESVSSNIYSSDGTLTANRIMDGANNELLFQTMGKFSVHSHANNIDNVVFEVRTDAVYHSFIIKDHNTGVHILACRDGKVEISDAYFLPDVDGATNRVVKTNGLGQWGYGVIQDNGTNVSIGGSPDSNVDKQLFVVTTLPDGIFSQNSRTASGGTAGTFWTNGINAFRNIGAQIICQNSQDENIGLHIRAENNGQGGDDYGIWIQDGSEANGRFLSCNANGKANWVDLPSIGVGGSGTLNKLAKWTPDGQNLGNSIISDDGSYIFLSGSYVDNSKGLLELQNIKSVYDTANFIRGLKQFVEYSGTYYNNGRIYGFDNITQAYNGVYSVIGIKNGVNGQSTMGGYHIVGIHNSVLSAPQNNEYVYGIVNKIGVSPTTPLTTSSDVYGIFVEMYTTGGNNYIARFKNGTEGTGKFLKSVNSDGDANWSNIAVSDVTNLQSNLDGKTDKLITENVQTASYTLSLSDADKLVSMNVGTANTLTIPNNAFVPFPIGTQIIVRQIGTGATTFVADAGVTIQSFGNKVLSAGQYSMFTLIKTGTNTWALSGNLV